MTKTFLQFQSDGETRLELSAYALTPQEHSSVIAELEGLEACANESLSAIVVEFQSIDADSVCAVIRGEYDAVFATMKHLESSGWIWNES